MVFCVLFDRFDYCNAVAGSAMSYLAPPSRQSSRLHTRDKVLTPFRTRASSREHRTDTPTSSGDVIPDGGQSAASTLTRDQSEPAADSEMNSTTYHNIPIIVENYDTKVKKVTKVTAGSSMTSSVNVNNQSGTITSSAAGVGTRPTTAPKPATTRMTSAPQHHVTTASGRPVTSQLTSQPQNHAPSSAPVSLEQSRPFSPTTGPAELASIADNGQISPRLMSDENHRPSSGVSSIKFIPGSHEPPVHKFTPAQRSLSPPINPTMSSGVVRVPYVPTVGAVRSSSVGGNSRVLPGRSEDHGQLVTTSSSSLNNQVLTTSSQIPVDTRPFSPIASPYISQLPSFNQPPAGYRKVTAPNTRSLSNTNSTKDYRSSDIVQNQNRSFGASPQTPVMPSNNRSTASTASSLSSNPTVPIHAGNTVEGHVIQGQQRSNVYRPFSPEISQDGQSVPLFTPNSTIQHPLEATLSTGETPDVPSLYQHQPQNYHPSESSTMSGLPQGRPFSPQTGQVPSMNYHSLPVNYQNPQTSTIQDELQGQPQSRQDLRSTNYRPQTVTSLPPETSTVPVQTRPFSPQTRPFIPQTSQVLPTNYQPQPENLQQLQTSTMPGSPQVRPLSPQTGQIPSTNYQPQTVTSLPPETSTMPGLVQTRPFSPQTSQVLPAKYQSQPMNHHHSESSTISGLSQARPFSPQTRQVPPTNYQSQPVNLQQLQTSTMPGSPQVRPLTPQPSQVPQPNISTTSAPSQLRPLRPHVGVKQHVQRFSTPGNVPTQQQQQSGVRLGAPVVTSHTGYDVTTVNSVHAQDRSLTPRDVAVVQSSAENHFQGHSRSNSSLARESNVGVNQSWEQRPFSPSAAQVTWTMTSHTHTEQYHGPEASMPPAWSQTDDVIQRPFSPRTQNGEITQGQLSPTGYELQITEPGNGKFSLPVKRRPFNSSTAQDKTMAKTQVGTKPEAKMDFRVQIGIDQMEYEHYGPTVGSVDSAVSQRLESRPFSPPTDQLAARQPVYRPVTSPLPVQPTLGQPDHYPATSTIPGDQRNGQPVYRPVTSPLPAEQTVGQAVHRPFTSPLPGDQRVGQQVYRPATSPIPGKQTIGQPVYYPATITIPGDLRNGQQIYSPVPAEQTVGQVVHRPFTSPSAVPEDTFVGQRTVTRPFSASGDQRTGPAVYNPPTSPAVVPVESSSDQINDGRLFSPSSDISVDYSVSDRGQSPAVRPFSPTVSSTSHQRPSSAPSSSMSASAAGNIHGYRRICFSPLPQQTTHRASPVPLMMSQQPASESRISVSGARLVFAAAPRRGSDVTAAVPSYLTSSLTSSTPRSPLDVLRENQVADWKDSRRPVMWIPPPPPATTGRSQSLEPVSGFYLLILYYIIYINSFINMF